MCREPGKALVRNPRPFYNFMTAMDEYLKYKVDVDRISRACRENGLILSNEEWVMKWRSYSAIFAAGWIGLLERDEDLWPIIRYHVSNIENDSE